MFRCILVVGAVFLLMSGLTGFSLAEEQKDSKSSCCGAMTADNSKTCPMGGKAVKASDKKMLTGNQMICSVTGNKFEATKETLYSVYKGKVYYFCCAGCKPMFDKDPEKYLNKK